MEKYSSRRQAVLEAIKNNRCHPSADMIYEECRKTIPNISLATVYRNLAYYEKRGLVGRVAGCGEKERFDIETDTHCHSICRICGKIEDIPYPEEMKKFLDGYCCDRSFDSYGLSFYNVCEECKSK